MQSTDNGAIVRWFSRQPRWLAVSLLIPAWLAIPALLAWHPISSWVIVIEVPLALSIGELSARVHDAWTAARVNVAISTDVDGRRW